MDLPESIKDLVVSFSSIPGIGEKTALRHVLSLAKWNESKVLEFSQAVKSLASLNSCDECGFYLDLGNACPLCSDSSRKESLSICVVESITDLLAIQRSGAYQGMFHVLKGVLNPLLGIGPEEAGVSGLIDRVGENGIKSILLAVNPSVEGDATCSYIRQQIEESVKVERIGFGMPMGGVLEYLDSQTISKALENRKTY